MRNLLSVVSLAFWLAGVSSVVGTEPALRILKSGPTEGGLFQLQIASAPLAYEVQASADLRQWVPLHTNLAIGSVAEFQDANSRAFRQRFYRLAEHRSALTLSRTDASPGDALILTGFPFDPSVRTRVRFQDPAGLVVSVPAFAVTPNTVTVAVPFLVNVSAPQSSGGTVTVSLEQETPSGSTLVVAGQALRIADLPPAPLPPGSVTLAYLNHISNLLATASSRWQTLETASGGKLDAAALRRDLLAMQTTVAAGATLIQGVISGQTPRLSLGRIGDRELALDLDAVARLDRMIVASLNYRSRGTWLAKASATPAANPDVATRMDEVFNPGDSSQATFDLFDQFNSVGGMGVGILAATAVVLGVASAPAAAAVAGTAGAVLFFSTYVAPAVMGASALALTAPFLEVQTGQTVTLEDYRPALNHIQKGSRAYLFDELQGNVISGVFASRGASEDLIARASLFVSTSQSILGNLDLSKPESAGSQATANYETIVAGLHPPDDSMRFSGNPTTTFNSASPDGGWEEQLTATITMEVRGLGTPQTPFSGTFRFDGRMVERLIYCHSVDVPCDPGGTYYLTLSDGVVTGSGGVVAADGTGTITFEGAAAPLPFRFTGGVFSGNTLTGTLALGDLEEMLIVLTRQ